MKDNRQDELTYNDKWRMDNPTEAAAATVLKLTLEKQHCIRFQKLDDWKLMVFATMMESNHKRFGIPRMALVHLLDMSFALLECQTKEQFIALAEKEEELCVKRQLERLQNLMR